MCTNLNFKFTSCWPNFSIPQFRVCVLESMWMCAPYMNAVYCRHSFYFYYFFSSFRNFHKLFARKKLNLDSTRHFLVIISISFYVACYLNILRRPIGIERQVLSILLYITLSFLILGNFPIKFAAGMAHWMVYGMFYLHSQFREIKISRIYYDIARKWGESSEEFHFIVSWGYL